MKLRWRVAFVGAAALGVVLAACVGDSPGTATPSGTDGGVEAAPPPTNDAGPPLADAAGPPPTVLSVDIGDEFGCALLSDGTVWCWGDNQLGQQGVAPPSTIPQPAAQVPNLTGVKAIAVGGSSACAILAVDSTVWCWGESEQWQTGHDPVANHDFQCGLNHCQPTPTKVPTVFAASVSINQAEACAITTNHSVVCWGGNHDGQCGIPPTATAQHVLPTVMSTLKNIVSLRLGYYAADACALDSSGDVWCWGKNTLGALGHPLDAGGDLAYGDGLCNPVPRKAVWPDGGTFDHVVDVVAGATTCAVRDDGTVWCWGNNRANHLTLSTGGDGTPHPSPVQVKGIAGATGVGYGVSACALIDGGAVYCWGAGPTGVAPGPAVDNGCTTLVGGAEKCQAPAQVPGPPFAAIDVDHISAAGLTVDGKPLAWGANGTTGRLGRAIEDGGGDAQGNPVPAPIPGLP